MLKLLGLLMFVSLQLRADVKPEMRNFYRLLEKIQGYSLEKKDYFSKKNEKEIEKTLRQFNETIFDLKKQKKAEADDMKFRLRQLEDGLAEAETAFRINSKDYSYWALKSSLSNCYICHTQKSLPALKYKLSTNDKASLFSRAEFLYLVRNYSESAPLFEKVILAYPAKATVEELEASIQKLLYYFVRVQKNDPQTLALFDRILLNEALPATIRNDILAWKKYLNIKKFGLVEEPQLNSYLKIENYITERNNLAGSYRLSNQRYIIDLETTQRLFEVLEKSQDQNLRPWVLYWMAYQEKDYRQTMFDMSVESYLRECIEKYSVHPAAKKCFVLYKEMQTDGFTGSRGTDIPASVQKQIEAYEKLVHER